MLIFSQRIYLHFQSYLEGLFLIRPLLGQSPTGIPSDSKTSPLATPIVVTYGDMVLKAVLSLQKCLPLYMDLQCLLYGSLVPAHLAPNSTCLIAHNVIKGATLCRENPFVHPTIPFCHRSIIRHKTCIDGRYESHVVEPQLFGTLFPAQPVPQKCSCLPYPSVSC